MTFTYTGGNGSAMSVYMSTATAGATIFYTKSNTDPAPMPTHSGTTPTGSTLKYTGAVNVAIGAEKFFAAIAYKSGMTDSTVTYYDADNTGGGMMMMGAMAMPTMVTTKTFSVWDGDWAILEEYDSTGARVQGYVQGYHGLVKTLVGNGIYYYQDELGSTSHIADATGHLLEYYKYNLYGAPQYFDSTSQQLNSSAYGVKDLGNGGSRWMSELGLYDNRNRFMSPDLGRFLQPDPIGFKGDGSNLYRYCGNDWSNRVDLTGLDDIPISREVDVRLWQASMNSLHEALRMHDGNGRSQMVQIDRKGNISLGSKFAPGQVERYVRPEYTYGHNGEPYGYIRHEYNHTDSDHDPIGPGHAHMDVTGRPFKDSPDFSISKQGKDSDYSAAQKGQIVAKVNESDPNHVFRLTPQTDGSKPQVREIAAPTKEELKKWPNSYDRQQQQQQQQQSKPQAANAEPSSEFGGGGIVDMGSVIFGSKTEGLRSGGTP